MNKLIRRFFFSFLLCLLIWLGGLAWFIDQIPDQPTEETTHADAIIVLTGGSGRLEHGLELLADDKGKSLFISGVSRKTKLNDLMQYASPSVKTRVAPKSGSIILGHEAENTIGNASETTRWLRKEGHKTIYLVTSNYHMPRSLAEFRELARDITFLPAPVFPEDFKRNSWWHSKDSRNLVLLEYHKLLASKLRHWFVSAFRNS